MKAPRVLVVLVALALPLLSSCGHQTLQSRVNERRDVFAGLAPREQAMIKRGLIAVGFTTDMVYLALDKPDRVSPGPGPMQETWIYQTYYAPDGSSLIPSQKINTHWAEDTAGLGATSGPDGPTHRMPGSPPSARPGWSGNLRPELVTTTVDYDHANSQIKDPAQTRVEIIFLRGRVADIRVSRI